MAQVTYNWKRETGLGFNHAVYRVEASDGETVNFLFNVKAAIVSWVHGTAMGAADAVSLQNSDASEIDGTDAVLTVQLVGTTTDVELTIEAWG